MDDSQKEIEDLIRVNPGASAGYAFTEMHFGRLDWLAEHIELCDFQIDPLVARKLLEMLKGSNPSCMFEIRAVRREGLPPRAQDPQLRLFRAADMAIEVARLCRFKRGKMKQACHEVGMKFGGLKGQYVAREIRQLRDYGLSVVEEEEAAAAFERGEIDFLGRPIRS